MTEAGAALLPHALAVQRELEAAERSVRDLAGEVSGDLRLATSHHIGLHRLPPVLSSFSRDFPDVHLDIDFTDSEQAHEMILRGAAELAVVTLAPASETSLISLPVWQDPLDIMVARDHPLLTRGTSLDLAALSEHTAILPGLNTFTGQIGDRHQRWQLPGNDSHDGLGRAGLDHTPAQYGRGITGYPDHRRHRRAAHPGSGLPPGQEPVPRRAGISRSGAGAAQLVTRAVEYALHRSGADDAVLRHARMFGEIKRRVKPRHDTAAADNHPA